MPHKDTILAYTDGSCHNATNSRGGYGVYITWNGKQKRIAGGRYDRTTNNRMELMAVIAALRAVRAKRGFRVHIVSDSQYVVGAINEGWVFDWEESDFLGKKNADLWREFLREYRRFRPEDLTFSWTRGHVGEPGNEEADRLAALGGSRETILIDEGSGL